jgi:hypothetical protein
MRKERRNGTNATAGKHGNYGRLERSVGREEGHRLWKRDRICEWFVIDGFSYG